jgi:hypothetical protein
MGERHERGAAIVADLVARWRTEAAPKSGIVRWSTTSMMPSTSCRRSGE